MKWFSFVVNCSFSPHTSSSSSSLPLHFICLLPPCVLAHSPMILWAFPSIAPAASQHQRGKEGVEEEVVVLDPQLMQLTCLALDSFRLLESGLNIEINVCGFKSQLIEQFKKQAGQRLTRLTDEERDKERRDVCSPKYYFCCVTTVK